jgi:hypothetical protein
VGGSTIFIDTIHIGNVTMTGTPAPTVRWHVGPVVEKGHNMPLEVSLTTEQKVRLSVTPMTPGGQPATLDGPVQWSVEGACTLEAIDATSTWVLSGSTIGDSIVTVAADADLGQGVVPIGDSATLHVSDPMAASLGMAADEPVLKP